MSSKSKRQQKSHTPRKRPHVKNLGINCNLPPEFEIIGMTGTLPQIVLRRTTHKKVKETSTSGEFNLQHIKTFAAIATHAWRAKERMLDPASGEPREGMDRLYRNIEGIYQALLDAGVEIKDYTGGIYDTGMALKALSFEPTHGISREEVKETVRPSVLYKEHIIQLGEVIVATPVDETLKTGEEKNEQNNN